MKTNFILSFLLILLLNGCSTMNDDYQTKLDSGLRMELQNSNGNLNEQIRFIGKCTEEITSKLRTKIEATGVEIENVIKNIFTASGTRDQIIELAKIEEINNLEKSKQVYPNN